MSSLHLCRPSPIPLLPCAVVWVGCVSDQEGETLRPSGAPPLIITASPKVTASPHPSPPYPLAAPPSLNPVHHLATSPPAVHGCLAGPGDDAPHVPLQACWFLATGTTRRPSTSCAFMTTTRAAGGRRPRGGPTSLPSMICWGRTVWPLAPGHWTAACWWVWQRSGGLVEWRHTAKAGCRGLVGRVGVCWRGG